MKKITFFFMLICFASIAISQNVGIGTTAPSSKLTINATSLYSNLEFGHHGMLIGNSSNGSLNLFMGADDVNGVSYIQSVKRGMNKAPLILNPQGGNVGIGTITPHASALLDLSSTTQGFLPPRLTLAQRNAIVNPAQGLTIFCTTCEEIQVFNGTKWTNAVNENTCKAIGVEICNMVWSTQNLNVTTYRNGDPIQQITQDLAWSNLTSGAWCHYANGSSDDYGKLYNWHAINDPRNIAPVGWHVPTEAEWAALSSCLGGNAVAGGKLKIVGGFNPPNTGATNSSGFAAIAVGNRDHTGAFGNQGNYALMWATNAISSSNASNISLSFFEASISFNSWDKRFGMSVRLVRD